jgi:peptide alpha-N-acetyltransferase
VLYDVVAFSSCTLFESKKKKKKKKKQKKKQTKKHTNNHETKMAAAQTGARCSPSLSPSSSSSSSFELTLRPLKFESYDSELQMPMIVGLIEKDLSEPYSIFTYRYFINNWPELCWMAFDDDEEEGEEGEFEASSEVPKTQKKRKMVGCVVCKLDRHTKKDYTTERGYIAMLAVDKEYRKRGIGSSLVKKAIETMKEKGCEEVVLETEITNKGALALYTNLGFVKDKRLCRYYLNGVDAFRLKVWFA